MFRFHTILLFLTTVFLNVFFFIIFSLAAGLLTPAGSANELDIKSHNVNVSAIQRALRKLTSQ